MTRSAAGVAGALALCGLAWVAPRPRAAAPVPYWSAVHWGFWGEVLGRFAAAPGDVAAKVCWRGETLAALR